jgi:4a-hydroxytetrahydrobiopterin dehydratase
MSKLKDKECELCTSRVKSLSIKDIESIKKEIPEWSVVFTHNIIKIQRKYKFNNFNQAIKFSSSIAVMAESQNHHPEMLIEWGAVTVTWWTHSIDGLHINDFICAAKTDNLFN